MAKDSLSDEDKALFREQMRSVKPLQEKHAKVGHSSSTLPRSPIKKPFHDSNKQEFYLSDFISNPVQSNTILSYRTSDVPNQRFKELKNGLIPWEKRLDLHGLYTEDARQALVHFIKHQINEDVRCLLIIHGKGGHQGAPPVIKNMVNRWLSQFSEVIAFHSALPKHGGNGAVYVLLKKNRVYK